MDVVLSIEFFVCVVRISGNMCLWITLLRSCSFFWRLSVFIYLVLFRLISNAKSGYHDLKLTLYQSKFPEINKFSFCW
jgi:hypothetical protein